MLSKKQALVLEGNRIKLRLQERRSCNRDRRVHVDWLRFTVQRKYAPTPSLSTVFRGASLGHDYESVRDGWEQWEVDRRDHERLRIRGRICELLKTVPDADYFPTAQAHSLAEKVVKILGQDFLLDPELKKGQDFYRFRWSITRNGKECAWVGFLASGDSPRQKLQAQTIHVNLFGAACTFARADWCHRMATLIDDLQGKLTRVDLALDFFEGISGGLDRVRDEWHRGVMDVRGRRPSVNMVGAWVEGGRGRSFYFGSREAGKQTNVYEKGVQLFGADDATKWERIELRYGNKLRELPTSVLLRPDDFFAGASEWHSAMLSEHGRTVDGEPIKVKAKQAIQTVKAEVTRSVRWLTNTASQSLAMAFKYLDEDRFLSLVTGRIFPARLQRFSESEVAAAFVDLNDSVFQPTATFAIST